MIIASVKFRQSKKCFIVLASMEAKNEDEALAAAFQYIDDYKGYHTKRRMYVHTSVKAINPFPKRIQRNRRPKNERIGSQQATV